MNRIIVLIENREKDFRELDVVKTVRRLGDTPFISVCLFVETNADEGVIPGLSDCLCSIYSI